MIIISRSSAHNSCSNYGWDRSHIRVSVYGNCYRARSSEIFSSHQYDGPMSRIDFPELQASLSLSGRKFHQFRRIRDLNKLVLRMIDILNYFYTSEIPMIVASRFSHGHTSTKVHQESSIISGQLESAGLRIVINKIEHPLWISNQNNRNEYNGLEQGWGKRMTS